MNCISVFIFSSTGSSVQTLKSTLFCGNRKNKDTSHVTTDIVNSIQVWNKTLAHLCPFNLGLDGRLFTIGVWAGGQLLYVCSEPGGETVDAVVEVLVMGHVLLTSWQEILSGQWHKAKGPWHTKPRYVDRLWQQHKANVHQILGSCMINWTGRQSTAAT